MESLLVPERCLKCKRLFDLKYDLAGFDWSEDGLAEPLCWKCRVISLFSKMTGKTENISGEEEEELELMWENMD
ncbi:hypothetical protein COU62_00160 [Candidatus Pacearchaeota archaeon CG10_big_fil_rev_8_21_14_0_10_35_219]|nr:hypothetical protein [Candidatus Pacearchaeota archaeon]OIO41838.1 MAG: hypothetical protein AUJ63_04750 [Candidatus Pacearchaeota archaeon CG1_02_35_32]PIO08488.1 MAG: hypothetical protein COU62_00160 [Candidatus Pacearchaeota archaeon CG10_big_fil_rev_8_21_14_0_10_35_219]PIY81791.1 MAG: hypothetical protein COY79_00620 [Candidatus Pacearchaeota archaeon CG_4_10_14_0_8_um_filter_35_169]PIZ80092.1 MAG: hypothetical protein COY00_02375 [Candidatus Pacearchaeota archaeon CG_4_10_14_0_2_um_filt